MAPHFARFLPALIMVACVVMASGHVRAQGAGSSQTGSDITASLGDRSKTDAPATREIHELKTVGVSATVTVLRTGRPFPAGGSAFAQIKLKNTSKTKRVGAELALETVTATIRDVSGNAVTVREDGTARIATVEKIAKGKPRLIIVEVGLGEEISGSGSGEPRNILKITLRQPGGTGETLTLGWNVANCARGFYSQIVKVRQGSGAGLKDAIKAARTKDRTRPGRWLFPPRLNASKASRKCLRWAKRWSKRRGRNVFRCTKYETIEPVVGKSVV